LVGSPSLKTNADTACCGLPEAEFKLCLESYQANKGSLIPVTLQGNFDSAWPVKFGEIRLWDILILDLTKNNPVELDSVLRQVHRLHRDIDHLYRLDFE
jgi:hypothetical protein